MPDETRNAAATIAESFMKPPSGGGAEVLPQSGQQTRVHCYPRAGSPPFPPRVAAPAGVKREIETAARAAERGGIGVELGGVAGAFLVEERLDRRAFVPAGLEVDHPEPAVAAAEHSVHHVRPPSLGGVDAYAVFAARELVRSEDPAPALVGERVAERYRSEEPTSELPP